MVAFAHLAQLSFMDKEVSHPLRDAIDDHQNLLGLVSRIKERAYVADWEEMCASLDINTHLPKPVKEVSEAKEDAELAEAQPEEADLEKGKVFV